jgi:hypothetical protein
MVKGRDTILLSKTLRPGIFLPPNRTNYMGIVTITEGVLKPGNQVKTIWGDTRKGSKGMMAPLIRLEKIPCIAALVIKGDTILVPDPPVMTSKPDKAFELRAMLPTKADPGTTPILHISVIDEFLNQVTDFQGKLDITRLGTEDAAISVTAKPGDKGVIRTPVTISGPGIYRYVVGISGKDIVDTSNAMVVTESSESNKIYWGDIHSHGFRSWDGAGNIYFQYAREVSRLDFYCITDHSQGMSDSQFVLNKKETIENHKPGEFVTIVGHELSLKHPSGHYNIYYRDTTTLYHELREIVLANKNGDTSSSINTVWKFFHEKSMHNKVLTIPHHTGIHFSRNDMTRMDSVFKPVVEIFSGHGLGEAYEPEHPNSYENTLFSLNHAAKDPTYVQDGWLLGDKIGTIASSDNHTSQPGLNFLGHTAVFAEKLTREAVFDALKTRSCYGTTGARIILDFKINDNPMGTILKSSGQVKIYSKVIGTSTLETVEILRGYIGDKKFNTVHAYSPSSGENMEAEIQVTDKPAKNAVYYLRVTQKSRARAGFFGMPRVEMAWSSPIWVEKD